MSEGTTMLTVAEIASAKNASSINAQTFCNAHDDCVRIAYEWLDAQIKPQPENDAYEQRGIGPDLFRHPCKFGLDGMVSRGPTARAAIPTGSKVKNPKHTCGTCPC